MQAYSWGNLNCAPQQLLPLYSSTKKSGLAYGRGRSYGDVCLNTQGILWNTSTLDNFIHFDSNNGQLRCEAGVLLGDILKIFIPQGWMLPVLPGTQFVTVGGAIANDIHGKNHHIKGSFGNQLIALKLLRTTGEIIECNRNNNSDLFAATIGGLGLTGIILEATLQLRPIKNPWLDTENIAYNSLDEFFHLAYASEAQYEYTVSWLDCSSPKKIRGIFMRANHSEIYNNASKIAQHPQKNIPINLPFSLITKTSLRIFNEIYFYHQKQLKGIKQNHYQSFFFPLDQILNWNRIYGYKGFYQYQSVIPRKYAKEATALMIKEISQSGQGSFLSVLKTFGKQKSLGMLSFPQEGTTLALDFPNKGLATENLFQRLDAIVLEAGGRLYPAKDARMPKTIFKAGYPNLASFLSYCDPGIQSDFARRLGLVDVSPTREAD